MKCLLILIFVKKYDILFLKLKLSEKRCLRLFKRKKYKRNIKKIGKNLYSLKGHENLFREFFKDYFLNRDNSIDKKPVTWNIEPFERLRGVKNRISVYPFMFSISGCDGCSYRQFSYKGVMDSKSRYNDLRDYGSHVYEIEIKYEFVGNVVIPFLSNQINVLSVTYYGLHGKTEVGCIDNIPQYWNYDEFFLIVSEGSDTYYDNENMNINTWVKDENGIFSGYIKDIDYGNLCWCGYDRIGDKVFKKWSNAYQATVDIFDKDCEHFSVKDIEYTITTLAMNIRYLEKTLHFGDKWYEERIRYINEYPFGCFVEGHIYNNTYNSTPLKKFIGHDISDFILETHIPDDFRFVKLYIKKGNFIPDNLELPFNVLREDDIAGMRDYSIIPKFVGYYPVRIEFLDTGFKEIASIDFDKFGVAKFNNFIKIEQL